MGGEAGQQPEGVGGGQRLPGVASTGTGTAWMNAICISMPRAGVKQKSLPAAGRAGQAEQRGNLPGERGTGQVVTQASQVGHWVGCRDLQRDTSRKALMRSARAGRRVKQNGGLQPAPRTKSSAAGRRVDAVGVGVQDGAIGAQGIKSVANLRNSTVGFRKRQRRDEAEVAGMVLHDPGPALLTFRSSWRAALPPGSPRSLPSCFRASPPAYWL